MRINLTKEEIVNSIYMQIGYSKKISENLLEDFFEIIFKGLKKNKCVVPVIKTNNSVKFKDFILLIFLNFLSNRLFKTFPIPFISSNSDFLIVFLFLFLCERIANL